MEVDELSQRLKDHEDGWIERKTKNIKDAEILEALVGFANSVPIGQQGLLVIGVSDDGKPLGVDNADKLQKKIHRLSEWCYPIESLAVSISCSHLAQEHLDTVAFSTPHHVKAM
jgi:predicted HTH transcriptional regulator